MERAIKRNRRQCGAKRRLCMLLSCLWPQRLQMVRMTAALIALIAEAYALLHDTAARAKDGRRKPWAEARQKWAEKAGKA